MCEYGVILYYKNIEFDFCINEYGLLDINEFRKISNVFYIIEDHIHGFKFYMKENNKIIKETKSFIIGNCIFKLDNNYYIETKHRSIKLNSDMIPIKGNSLLEFDKMNLTEINKIIYNEFNN